MILYTHEWIGSSIRDLSENGAKSIFNYFKDKLNYDNIIELKGENPQSTIPNDDISYRDHYRVKLNQIADKISEIQPEKIVHIGGGCALDIPIILYLKNKFSNLVVIWFDAHGDLHTPITSKSKYIHGMALGLLVRDNDFLKTKVLSVEQIHLSHIKDLDESENDYINESNVSRSSNYNELSDYVAKLAYTTPVFVHIDFDVFHPKEVLNIKSKTVSGIKIFEMTEFIKLISKQCNLVGVSLLENVDCNNKQLFDLYKTVNYVI